jgi:hypothetical protein
MNGRMLMARLNARSVRWDGVRGGVSEFSAQDIAAALGMIKHPFARELFCFLWWPDGARSSSSDIERMMLHRILEECVARATEASLSRLTYKVAELELTRVRSISKLSETTLERYRVPMEIAEKRKWPAPRAVYRLLVQSVLTEMASPTLCPQCHGVGQYVLQGQEFSCTRCDGSGATTLSDLARARQLDMTWHAYRKAWKAPYEWAIQDCRAAEMAAERALCRHLGDAQRRAS